LVHELWNDLPKEKEKEEVLNNIRIDAAALLPADRGYYTFSGSLTTPPCSEGVTWFVLKHSVSVSDAEIEQFSKLYRNEPGGIPACSGSVLQSLRYRAYLPADGLTITR
jgi:carbonic anhydrase